MCFIHASSIGCGGWRKHVDGVNVTGVLRLSSRSINGRKNEIHLLTKKSNDRKEICIRRIEKGHDLYNSTPPKHENTSGLCKCGGFIKQIRKKELETFLVTKLIPNVTVGRVPGSIVMSPRCQTGDGKIAGSPFLAVVVPANHPGMPQRQLSPLVICINFHQAGRGRRLGGWMRL